MEQEARQVLVVEDEAPMRNLLVGALEDEGYAVRAVPDGCQALGVLRQWRPDLILLDLMMPGLDGWGLRDRLLADDAWSRIPVVVLSAAHNAQGDIERLRASAILSKPFDLDALLATIAALI